MKSLICALLLAAPVAADTIPAKAGRVFAENCFSPFLTARRAEKAFGETGARYDFYDLDPFTNAAPSPAYGPRAATEGTDRRCEVSFDGAHLSVAVELALAGLTRENINTEVPVPKTHKAQAGTELLAARRLNPRRVAVVHVGTRQGPNGVETFMLVERLKPGQGGS